MIERARSFYMLLGIFPSACSSSNGNGANGGVPSGGSSALPHGDPAGAAGQPTGIGGASAANAGSPGSGDAGGTGGASGSRGGDGTPHATGSGGAGTGGSAPAAGGGSAGGISSAGHGDAGASTGGAAGSGGVLAFPGAQGFGRLALGARGGSVYHVTNLDDDGVGSLRDAISQPDRTVVFDVGGVIKIASRLIFRNNQTIAGQTAPGGGITVYGDGTSFSAASNTIVRYMRFRMGKIGEFGKDAVTMANGHDVIWDHCSMSWGRDGTLDLNQESGSTLHDLEEYINALAP